MGCIEARGVKPTYPFLAFDDGSKPLSALNIIQQRRHIQPQILIRFVHNQCGEVIGVGVVFSFGVVGSAETHHARRFFCVK